WREAGRIGLEAIEELGVHEHARERTLNARLEAGRTTGSPIEAQQRRHVVSRQRPPVGPASQSGQDLRRARLLLLTARRVTDKEGPSARRLGGPLSVVGAADLDGRDAHGLGKA